MAIAEKEAREGLASFFGEVDKGSGMPGWCFEEQMNQIEESVRYKKKALDQDIVSGAEKMEMRESLNRDEERLEKIKSSRPKYNSKEQDEIAKMTEVLGEKISEAMPTRTQLDKRLVDAHDEVKRSLDPCLEVGQNGVDARFVDLAQLKTSKVKNKVMVSRDEATRAWQIARKYLEENSNPECLRRD